jgi:hypothetical protein
MKIKKDKCRFIIQFNSADSKHYQVAEILNRQGRRKARYIVNAVLCYENKLELDVVNRPVPLDYHTVEVMVKQILDGKTIIQECVIKESGEDKFESKHMKLEDTVMEIGKEELSAIADSISEFRRKK